VGRLKLISQLPNVSILVTVMGNGSILVTPKSFKSRKKNNKKKNYQWNNNICRRRSTK